jgi:hypothetical protein
MERKRQKVFVILFGPPASGKGRMVTELGLEFPSLVHINVDAIVARMVSQAKAEAKAVRRVNTSRPQPTENSQKQYWNLRKLANAENDRSLHSNIEKQANIAFETTGRNVDWLVNTLLPRLQSDGYRIILAVPLVLTREMSKRCASREQEADCSIDYLSGVKRAGFANFAKTAAAAHEVRVYDNNTGDMTLLYRELCRTPTCTTALVYDAKNANANANANAGQVQQYMSMKCRR